MTFLNSEIIGNNAVLMLQPSSDSAAKVLSFVNDMPVPSDHIGAYVAAVASPSDETENRLDTALENIAARFTSIEGEVTELTQVYGPDGEFVGQALVIESTPGMEAYDLILDQLEELDYAFSASESMALIVLASTSEDEEAIDAQIIGEKITFNAAVAKTASADELAGAVFDSKLPDQAEYQITKRDKRCDGFAVVSSGGQLVCCHTNRTQAEETLAKKMETAAEGRDENLVGLGDVKQDREKERFETIDEFKAQRINVESIGTLDAIFAITLQDENQTQDTIIEDSIDELESEDHSDNEPKIPNWKDAGIQLPLDMDKDEDIADKNISFMLDGEISTEAVLRPQDIAHHRQRRKLENATPDLAGFAIFTNLATGDGRVLPKHVLTDDDGTLRQRPNMMPYMFSDEKTMGHMGSKMGGVIKRAELVAVSDDQLGVYTETILLNTEFGREIERGFSAGEYKSVSADLTEAKYIEIQGRDGEMLLYFTSARFMGMTGVPFPAVADAGLWFIGDDTIGASADDDSALVASGAELYKPQVQIFSDISLLAEGAFPQESF